MNGVDSTEPRGDAPEIACEQTVQQDQARSLGRRKRQGIDPPERSRRRAEQIIEDEDRKSPEKEGILVDKYGGIKEPSH